MQFELRHLIESWENERVHKYLSLYTLSMLPDIVQLLTNTIEKTWMVLIVWFCVKPFLYFTKYQHQSQGGQIPLCRVKHANSDLSLLIGICRHAYKNNLNDSAFALWWKWSNLKFYMLNNHWKNMHIYIEVSSIWKGVKNTSFSKATIGEQVEKKCILSWTVR